MPRASNNQTPRARILILEDDPLQAQILESVMVAATFEVDAVSSGLDAVRQMQRVHYDVVVVDYQVPEINGLALAKLADDFMGPVVRPILIALTATPEHLRAMESGAHSAFDAVIGKSSDFSSLLSAITRCLAAMPDSATRQTAESSLLRKDRLDYEAEPCRPGAQGDDPGPPRILVVEDEECQRLLLTSVLEQRGYVVENLSNGLEAVRQIREGCYDLALVDYNLPEMDGLAAGTLILDLLQEHVRPRLIALTSTPARLRDREMLVGSVFDEIIEKSADLHDLICAVDRHLRSSPNPATRRAARIHSGDGTVKDGKSLEPKSHAAGIAEVG